MKYQTWDENLASHTADVQAAARPLEDVIRTELPDVAVQYDPGNGLLAFGRSMKMRDLLFALIPHAGWVNLQLADGATSRTPTASSRAPARGSATSRSDGRAGPSNPVRDAVRAEIAAIAASPGTSEG